MRFSWKSGSAVFILLCLLIGLVFWKQELIFGNHTQSASKNDQSDFEEPEVIPPETSFLDGTDLSLIKPQEEYGIGVMIDNARAARAGQSGVDQAPLVFEALAEGGVTRFLAIFSSRQILDRIGPIRSARPYFLDFVKPLHGLFVHAGGSDTVLAELGVQEDILNIDHNHEYAESKTFWRDLKIAAPHNLFSSLENLKAKLQKASDLEGFQQLSEDIFHFSQTSLPGKEITSFSINFPGAEYDSEWQWNPETESFERDQQDSVLKFTAQNVVVMNAQMWPIAGDEKGRMEMKNVGSGPLRLFQNGKVISGTWRKTSRTAPLEILNLNGVSVLTLLPGKTWVVVVEDLSRLKVEYPALPPANEAL